MSPRKKVLLLKRWLNIIKNGASVKILDEQEKKASEIFPELNEISEILKGQLYLSGCRVVTKETLVSLGIKTVVRAITEEEERLMAESTKGAITLSADIKTMYVRIPDREDQDIGSYFESICDFVHSQIKAGHKVLIHCGAGVSRSTTLVIAYLIKYKHSHLRQAYQLVKEKRKIIRPNNGFFRQLIEYERTCRLDARSSVRMIMTPNGLSMPDIVYENALMAKLKG